ncbi:MAG: ATP synthase F1 subunit delta [Magnetococcales bacterium]|nr:ATP synthase F1 subunit delta [Magnetococcales bacterium]
MNENTLAKRYASALADLAAGENLLDDVGQQLSDFKTMLEESSDLRLLFTSPTRAQDVQREALDAILEKTAPATVTGNFLRLLIDKRRMGLIDLIVDSYLADVDTRSGRMTVNVRTPMPLTATHIKQLSASLAEKTGKEIKLDIEEDPSILGGMVVRIGSMMMDYSVRNRLNRLKAIMR